MKTVNFFIRSGMMLATVLMISCNNTHNPEDNHDYGDKQNVNTMNDVRGTNYNVNTQNFVREVAADGMTEIKLADLAMKNSNNSKVKDLAQMIKNDHQDANKKLEDIAKKNDWDIPGDLPEASRQKVDRLEDLRGDNFDREYLKVMVNAHKEAISKLEAALGKNANAESDAYNTNATNSANGVNTNGHGTNVNADNMHTNTKAAGSMNNPTKVSNDMSQDEKQKNNADMVNGSNGMTNNSDEALAANGSIDNAELQNWIKNTLPTLRKHLQRSEEVQNEVVKS